MIQKISSSNISFKSREAIFKKAKTIISRMSPEEALNNSVLNNLMKYVNRLDVENMTKAEYDLRVKLNGIRRHYSKELAKKAVDGVITPKEQSALKKYEEAIELIIRGTNQNRRKLVKSNKIK